MPQDCLLCGESCGAEPVCAACAGSLERCDDEGVAAAFAYRFPLDRLVQRFKYAADFAIGRWLAMRLAERVAREPRPHLLVAPPLSTQRLRERGFNQSLVLARTLGRRLGVRCAGSGVEKVRETSPQQGLSRRERGANLRGAFRCARDLRGLHVAVVDDVMTTGATVEALGEALRGAGARRVDAWVVARAPAPGA